MSTDRNEFLHMYALAVLDQKVWIKEHGETLVGYMEKYSDPDQAKAIYHADMEELRRLERRLMEHSR